MVQAVNVLDAGSLLAAFGALGIAVVLFAETGLLIGFFLPGDSLLFTAGLLCAPGTTGAVHLALPQVLTAAAVGTLAGSQTGYWIGRRGGRALLVRSRARRLHEGAARAVGAPPGRRLGEGSSPATATPRRSSSPASSPSCAPC
ncbi:hypothetical protein Scani_07550 [Streptomyces caniferus]|uniref:DedA family protein n=1 Tax=Streptomyces caniferus TaxID=285557 RepID=A0A640S0M4_9ACTN|nr:hypothetical protein Scani_07550 [Streptomyces caniferus]